jgi:hypothetical protein
MEVKPEAPKGENYILPSVSVENTWTFEQPTNDAVEISIIVSDLPGQFE